MLAKDKFLGKTKYLIYLIFIFFSQILIAETTSSKILNYNENLINSSALFIQNYGKEIQEGEIYESRYFTYLDMLKDQNIYRKSDESSNTES